MSAMITRAGATVAAGAVAAAAANSQQTAQARAAPPPPAATAVAAPSAARDLDDWELLAPQQDCNVAAPMTVPLLSPAALEEAANDLNRLVDAAARGPSSRRRRAASSGSGSSSASPNSDEGAAADAVIRSAAEPPQLNPMIAAAHRMLQQQPELQAAIAGGVANDPQLIGLLDQALHGNGNNGPALLGFGGASLGLPRLPVSPAVTVHELGSASSEGEEQGKADDRDEGAPLPYSPFDPLASLGHHLSRFGAWLRAKVVDPLLGLADEDDEEEEKEAKEEQEQVAAPLAAAQHQHRHRLPRTPAEEGIKDAADAWLGALTAAMIAIVCLAILRRPAAAREFVRAAMRGAAVAAAARR
jgi:hypothetical protein